MQRDRLNTDQLRDYYIQTAGGTAIPLSTIISLNTTVVPESINHFQQLNSATISAVPVPGVTLGQALRALDGLAKDTLPQGYSVDYGGQSTAIYPGVERPDRYFLLCPDHHFPDPGGPVRKFSRSVHCPGECSHVHLRRHDLYQPGHGRRQSQHLYGSGAGDVDRPHQQTRDPDRSVCQRPAERRAEKTRSHRDGGNNSSADRS